MKTFGRAKSLLLLEKQFWYAKHRREIFLALWVLLHCALGLFAMAEVVKVVISESEVTFNSWVSGNVGMVLYIAVLYTLLIFLYARPGFIYKLTYRYSSKKLHPSTKDVQERLMKFYQQLADKGDPEEDPVCY